MTNEKAIDLLRRIQEPEAYEPQITEEAFEALEMAIRALGTDKNVGTTDAISREAAIDEGMSYINGDCFCDKEDFAKYIEFIEQLPPIQQKLLQPWEVLVAQAVLPQPEIVRCKDCQHYKYGICKKAGLCVNKSQNGFCDWGERKQHEH